MDMIEAIRVRKSVRTFRAQEVARDLLDSLVQRFEKNERLNGLRVRLSVMRGEQVGSAMTGLVGSYGSIKDAPYWAIGISEPGEHYAENFGFRMEQFILECTREGLGTCWVGGFFKKSRLEEIVPKAADERVVCISPVGYALSRRPAEVVMRSLGGLNTRKPLAERVFYRKWGTPATDYLASRQDLLDLFELVRWAPSASNRQPCHYLLDGQKQIALVVDPSLHRPYPKMLTGGTGMSTNFQPVDAGIAMAHVHLGSRYLNMPGSWTLAFEPRQISDAFQIPGDKEIKAIFNFSRSN
jgi:hypothetical protein